MITTADLASTTELIWLTAKERRHFHGETSRPEDQAAAGHVAAKPTPKNQVLRSKLTELHSLNMAVESSETSTKTRPRVETEQLETVVSCFSPPACPEYQTTSMATKTNWSGNQSPLSTKRTGGQNARWKICQVHRR